MTRQQVALLLSSHEMNPLLPVMDRVIYVANGTMASGTTDEVVRPDVLSALYGHHVDVRARARSGAGRGGGSRARNAPSIADHPDLVIE